MSKNPLLQKLPPSYELEDVEELLELAEAERKVSALRIDLGIPADGDIEYLAEYDGNLGQLKSLVSLMREAKGKASVVMGDSGAA